MTTGARIRVTVIAPKDADVDVAAARRDLVRAVRKAVVEGQRFIATYPPQSLTSSGYVRTGTLKRSWSHKVNSGLGRIEGIVGSSSNIAPYNRFVQGAKPVPIFRTAGWRGVDDLEKLLQDRAEKEVGAIIERVADI